MRWHVVVHVEEEDCYFPDLTSDTPRLVLSFAEEADGFRMREGVLRTMAPRSVRKFEEQAYDLAVLAMVVYASDHCIERSTASDGWTREITLYVPVANEKAWNEAKEPLTRLLSFLSGDDWDLHFRTREYSPDFEPTGEMESAPNAVSLFSGGVDSLVGTIDLLERGRRLALVGHYGAGMTHHFQADVFDRIKKHYGERVASAFFFVEPPTIADSTRETTKRSRSFLFFALGLLVANAIDEATPLYVSENGLITLNVPFTDSRSGSLSTRTTHPFVGASFRELLSVLGLKNSIDFPYRFKTKGEMLAESANPALLYEILPSTMSCAHPEAARWHGLSPGTHCGYCVPCVIRRAAVAHAKCSDATYAIDVLSDPPSHETESGRDAWAIQIALNRYLGTSREHDICDVLSSGPIEPEEVGDWVSVYRRGIDELSRFFESADKKKGTANDPAR